MVFSLPNSTLFRRIIRLTDFAVERFAEFSHIRCSSQNSETYNDLNLNELYPKIIKSIPECSKRMRISSN